MANQHRFAAAFVLALGCSTSPNPFPTGGTGGSSNTGGASSGTTGGATSTPTGGSTQTATGGITTTGGVTSTGGSNSTSGGSTGGSTTLTGGVSNTGGLNNTSGAKSTGGSAGASTTGGAGGGSLAGGSAGTGTSGAKSTGGGASTGGAAGSSATGGAGGSAGSGGGSTRPAVPSAGCGKGGRPSGGVVTVDGDHIYTFPTNYDGNTPTPLVLAFHGANNPIDQIRTVAKGTDLEKNYVMAYLKSAGSGWVPSADNAHITKVYDELLANYCIDTSRVFATGHSSGAQLIVQMLCAGEKRFRAVAPVASSAYCSKWTAIPTLLIHGTNDQERASTSQDADGKKDLAPYLTSNACTMTTMPYSGVNNCNSTYNQAAVMPGCVEYQGCSQPMIWCHHNDGNYSGTNHGWPCFASNAMAAFFAKQ